MAPDTFVGLLSDISSFRISTVTNSPKVVDKNNPLTTLRVIFRCSAVELPVIGKRVNVFSKPRLESLGKHDLGLKFTSYQNNIPRSDVK